MIRLLLEIVSDRTNVPVHAISGRNREGPVADARHLAIWVASRTMRKTHSLADIGKAVGCDHTTVWFAIRKVEHLRQTNAAWLLLTNDTRAAFETQRSARRDRLKAACRRLAEELRA